ncbi:unnamed protein product [Gadus morhua 'NCC']
MALGLLSRPRNQCSVELLRSEGKKITTLRGIREELACLREQQERHHQEVMAYRMEKLASLPQVPPYCVIIAFP